MANKNTILETWKSPENNKRVICDHLVKDFARTNCVLEIGSGTGQHAVWFAAQMPDLIWQTSDRSENIEFIRQRLRHEGGSNIKPPIELDVDSNIWPDQKFDGIYAANCIHIMGWDSVVAMFRGIGNIMALKCRIALYGPFKYGGEFTTPSNADFDLWLKSQNPMSGIRDFEAVDELASNIGFKLMIDHSMPANNQLIIWGRA